MLREDSSEPGSLGGLRSSLDALAAGEPGVDLNRGENPGENLPVGMGRWQDEPGVSSLCAEKCPEVLDSGVKGVLVEAVTLGAEEKERRGDDCNERRRQFNFEESSFCCHGDRGLDVQGGLIIDIAIDIAGSGTRGDCDGDTDGRAKRCVIGCCSRFRIREGAGLGRVRVKRGLAIGIGRSDGVGGSPAASSTKVGSVVMASLAKTLTSASAVTTHS